MSNVSFCRDPAFPVIIGYNDTSYRRGLIVYATVVDGRKLKQAVVMFVVAAMYISCHTTLTSRRLQRIRGRRRAEETRRLDGQNCRRPQNTPQRDGSGSDPSFRSSAEVLCRCCLALQILALSGKLKTNGSADMDTCNLDLPRP